MSEFQIITESMVNVRITSNCNSFTSEKKFPKDLTIADLKGKLELITGASSISMDITAYDKNDKKVCDLSDNNALLGSYHVDSGMRLHVNDSSKHKDEFENFEKVEKFELSQDEYSKRDNTVQSFLRRNKLGKYNEEEMKKIQEEKDKIASDEEKLAAKITIDDRCQVKVPGSMVRRGAVKYVGKVHFKQGIWVGVQYDEPLGRNNGSVDGKEYFSCPNKYGGFVRIHDVEVGDFPEEDLGLSDDEI